MQKSAERQMSAGAPDERRGATEARLRKRRAAGKALTSNGADEYAEAASGEVDAEGEPRVAAKKAGGSPRGASRRSVPTP